MDDELEVQPTLECCDEPGCTRKQPIILQRTPDGEWFALTAYTEMRSGQHIYHQRHRLPESQQRQLNYLVTQAFGDTGDETADP